MSVSDVKRRLCLFGTIIMAVSAILLFFGSLPMPWDLQTWDGNSLDELSYRSRHSFYASAGLFLLIIGTVLQAVNLLKKEDIKWFKSIFKNKLMTNKNCIIIHGCPSDKEKALSPKTRTYDKHWIPWTKQELEKLGISTKTPLMPSPWEPVYESFKAEFEKFEVDENSILIGHSCGCTFLVRWLGDTKKKIHKLILVAPWKIEESATELKKTFYEFSFDGSIKERVDEIVMFTAPDEEEDGKKGLKMFHEALGGEIINLDVHGHYCLKNMGTEEFPELIKAVIK